MSETGEKVQLLSLWASPFVMRVQVALALKDVKYENVPQDLRNKSELLLHSNPVYGKVPVLLHNGRAVCESMVIVQYIDEAWPSSGEANLLPADPHERATARFWADYVDKKVLDAFFGVLRAKSEEERKSAEENVMAVLTTVEERALAGGGPFIGGKQMGLADVALVSLVAWLETFVELGEGLSIPWAEKLPRLEGCLAALRSHPAAACLPEPAKITDFVAKYIMPRFKQA